MLIVPVLSQRLHPIFHSEDPSQIKSPFSPFFLRDWSQLLTKLCKWKATSQRPESVLWPKTNASGCLSTHLAESRAGFTKENPICWSTSSPCSRYSPDSSPGSEAPLFLYTSCSLTDSSLSPWLQGLWWIVSRPSPICLVLLSRLDLFICFNSTPP